MQLLTLSQLRHHLKHRLQSLLAITGVALGVAVVDAVDITHHSAKQYIQRTQQQITGHASHRIVGVSNSLSERLYADLRRKLSSKYADIHFTPILTLKVTSPQHTKKDWIILGIDPISNTALTRFGVRGHSSFDSRLITQHNSVLISARTAQQLSIDVGDQMTLYNQNQPLTVSVADVFGETTDAVNQQLIVMDIGNAQAALNRHGQLSRIDVYIPDQKPHLLREITALLPDNTQLLANDQLLAGQLSLLDSFGFNLSILSILALLVGGFLIYITVRFSMLQRTPSLSRLRILGVSQRQLRYTLIREALCLSALGILIGLPLSWLLSASLTPISQRTLAVVYSLTTHSSVQFFHWPIHIKTALLATTTTLISYYLSYQSIQRLPLSHAIARFQADSEQGKRSYLQQILTAGLLTCSAWLVLRLPPSVMTLDGQQGLIVSYVGSALLVLAALCLIPTVLHNAYRPTLTLAQRLFGVIGSIAIRDSQRQRSRVLLAIFTLSLAVAATNGIAIMIDSFRFSVNQWLDTRLNAELYIHVQRPYRNQPKPLAAVVEQLQQHTSVNCLSYSHTSHTLLDNKKLILKAVSLPTCRNTSLPLIDQDSNTAIKRFNSGEILISEALARHQQLQIDDTLSLQTEYGKQAFRIAGIVREYSAEHGRIIIHRKHYQHWWRDTSLTHIGIHLHTPSEKQRLMTRLKQQLSDKPQLRILDTSAVRNAVMVVFNQTFASTKVLRLIVLLIAIIAIISTLVIYQLQQRQQLLTLRSLGVTIGELRLLFVIQACLIGSCAGLLAMPIGWLIAWALVVIINPAAFGWTLELINDPTIYGSGFIVALLAGLLGALYPCLSANRSLSLMEPGRE